MGGVRSIRRPLPIPAELLRREIPAGMPGFDGRGGGARHGWVRPIRASSGLERAPPRLIPEEDDRCFPLFAVASPFIPEGGCQRDPAAPLLERPCPEGPDRPRYMVVPLCQASWRRSTLLESFTGVMVRADLDQGCGVLSRVTSACMLMIRAFIASAHT